MRKLLLLLSFIFGFVTHVCAIQQLKIGQTEIVYLNPSLPSGAWLTSAGWSTDVIGLNYFDAGTWGAGIRVDGYWSGTATLSCLYTYSYYGRDGNIHVGSAEESWYYTCKGYPVTISPDNVTLDKGESASLKFSITGASIGELSPRWESSNKNVATVYSTGDYTAKVTAKAPGYCTITCYSFMGEPVTCDVTVNSFPPTGVSLTPDVVELTEGKSISLSCTLTPAGASAKKTWKSENTSIATVSNGKVTAVAPGTTRISVTTDNGLTAYSTVTVTQKFQNPRGPVSSSLAGSGTESSPYLITSAADLRYLADRVNSGTSFDGKYFKQTADIEINSGKYDSPFFKSQELWLPIGGTGQPFCGNYDGGNFVITGIYMEKNEDVYNNFKTFGLFGLLSGAATIKNLKLANLSINLDGSYVGGVVGKIVDGKNFMIENCHVYSGSVKSESAGGIIGAANALNGSSKISKCSNSASISCERFSAAGIIERATSTYIEISDCINLGDITSPNHAAGIVCYSSASKIYNCCNVGSITGDSRASGIACESTYSKAKAKTIAHCVNYGAVTCTKYGDKYTSAILCVSKIKPETKLADNYYLSDYALTKADAKYVSKSNNHPLSRSEMTSSGTLSELNSSLEAGASRWVRSSNGFPILDFYSDLTAGTDVPELSPAGTLPDDYHSISDDTEISVFSLTGQLLYKGPKRFTPTLNLPCIVLTNTKAFKVLL